MTPRLRASIERVMRLRVATARAVSGGDINEAYRVELANGVTIFVKANSVAPAGMFHSEAHGLDWLRQARALRVPEVLGVGGDDDGVPFLALEWIDSARPSAHFDERLGLGLAALHRYGASLFGLERDNFIGRLPQSNRRHERFRDFYVEERLLPQFELARRAGHFDATEREDLDRVIARIDDVLGPEEPPARLHGDLWSGNYLVGSDGEPCLIDPAVYGGHREIDLAMMRLFGGFSERVFAAYQECYPLAPGYRQRLPLMQLYPLLVHVNLFGGSYVSRVRAIVGEFRR